MSYVPSENDDLATLTEMAKKAVGDIFKSQAGYFTAQYWTLGKCLLAAQKKFGSQGKMYREWRDKLEIPIWTLSKAKLIAEAPCYLTQEDAAKDTVQIAFQKSKKKPTTQKDKAGKVDVKDFLWQVKQKMVDIAENLTYVSDDDDFVLHYTTLQELQETIATLLNRSFGRFDRLTNKPSNPKKGAA